MFHTTFNRIFNLFTLLSLALSALLSTASLAHSPRMILPLDLMPKSLQAMKNDIYFLYVSA